MYRERLDAAQQAEQDATTALYEAFTSRIAAPGSNLEANLKLSELQRQYEDARKAAATHRLTQEQQERERAEKVRQIPAAIAEHWGGVGALDYWTNMKTAIADTETGSVYIEEKSLTFVYGATQDEQAIRAGVLHAKKFWGGAMVMNPDSDDDFKRRMWEAAKAEGVKVLGYQPLQGGIGPGSPKKSKTKLRSKDMASDLERIERQLKRVSRELKRLREASRETAPARPKKTKQPHSIQLASP